MALKLLFLGRLADVAGAAERSVEHTSTLHALIANLGPQLSAALQEDRIKIAINGTVANDRAAITLKNGDEIAFLPPVSGG